MCETSSCRHGRSINVDRRAGRHRYPNHPAPPRSQARHKLEARLGKCRSLDVIPDPRIPLPYLLLGVPLCLCFYWPWRLVCEIVTILLDVLMASYHTTTLRGWPDQGDEDIYVDSPTVAKQRPGTQMRYLGRETGRYNVSLNQHRSGERPVRFFSSRENAEAAAKAANKSLGALRRGLIWAITLGVTMTVQLCNGGFIVAG